MDRTSTTTTVPAVSQPFYDFALMHELFALQYTSYLVPSTLFLRDPTNTEYHEDPSLRRRARRIGIVPWLRPILVLCRPARGRGSGPVGLGPLHEPLRPRRPRCQRQG